MDLSQHYRIALIGNPNVGKSTVFNMLTGLNQHTGNWPGKTVAQAQGMYSYEGQAFALMDLPGIYSLEGDSLEEEITRDYIYQQQPDLALVVADATCLERNLNLALQVLESCPRVLLCVNLLDEAAKKQIQIDLPKLGEELGIGVIGISARRRRGLTRLQEEIYRSLGEAKTQPQPLIPAEEGENQHISAAAAAELTQEERAIKRVKRSEEIYRACVKLGNKHYTAFDRRLDTIVTSRLSGIPLMGLLLALVLWLTISGANYPSQLLAEFFQAAERRLTSLFVLLQVAPWLQGLLIEGMFRTLGWVVSVMLPPMAIFFPLFTLLEDSGYLPRVAFNMDLFFKKAGACGKQCLTTLMGFGCNACGIIGCRIINSPRERLIAILTNSFVPCNGRFPTLIVLITLFFSEGQSWLGALLLTALIILGIGLTLAISRLLSRTLLAGHTSSFVLELPPYRRPHFGQVILRSICDRTLFVLGRAICVAAPAGLMIWLLANTQLGGISLLGHLTQALQIPAHIMGLDGVILLGFILGFPANEIVLPLIIMGYLGKGSISDFTSMASLHDLLLNNGWTWLTALCTILFTLIHFPCATTMWTIYKESGSRKWTALAFLIPTLCGFIICALTANLARLLMTLG